MSFNKGKVVKNTKTEQCILDTLYAKFTGKSGFISLSELQREIQVSRPTVIRNLRKLEEKQILIKTTDRGDDGSHLTNFYEIRSI
jgi:Mn-dependent DtxR family transcriptional regulator